MNDPKAPPVEIIGPSAPNGPPVPMEIAAERGFRMVTRGGILLRLVRICSMASGLPCPRMALEPYFAMIPTRIPPITGTKMTTQPNRSEEHKYEPQPLIP